MGGYWIVKTVNGGQIAHYVVHQDVWNWGETVKLVTPDGCGLISMSFSNGSPGVCYISGLSVVPEMRRQGIATNLMRACENYCKQRGIFRIDLNSRKEGWLIDFYGSLGYAQLFEEDGEMKMYKML